MIDYPSIRKEKHVTHNSLITLQTACSISLLRDVLAFTWIMYLA